MPSNAKEPQTTQNPRPRAKSAKSPKYKATPKETLKQLSIQQAASYRSFLIEELEKLEEILNELVPAQPPRPYSPAASRPERLSRMAPDGLEYAPTYRESPQLPPSGAQEIPKVEFSLASPMDPMVTEAELLGDIQNLYDYPNPRTGPELHTDSFGAETVGEGTSEPDVDSIGH